VSKKSFVMVLGAALMCVAIASCTTSPRGTPVFEFKEQFFPPRVPTITVAQDGTILAFTHACNLVRRSADGGKTWSAARKVGPDAGGNVIVDGKSGDVLVVHGSGYLYRSKDHGNTGSRAASGSTPPARNRGSRFALASTRAGC